MATKQSTDENHDTNENEDTCANAGPPKLVAVPAGSEARPAPEAQVRPLFARHAAELAASGISAETCAKAGVRSVDDAKEIARLLNWTDEQAVARAKELGACIAYGP